MPVLDGYEATAQLRSRCGFSGPIVAVTANAMASDKAKCLSSGMNDLLLKPFKARELLAVIRRYIPTLPSSSAAASALAAPAAALPYVTQQAKLSTTH